MSDDGRRTRREAADDVPDMTRERARTERRDLDKERGEPLAGGAARGGPRALRVHARPLGEWTSLPKILVTNDDGVESRGLLALKQALDGMGEVTVVAPDTNQSAVGHQKTLMRPLRVRERTLGDGSLAYSVDGSPTDAVSLAFLGSSGTASTSWRPGSTTARTSATTSPTRARSARRWRRSSTTARPSRSRRSTTRTPISAWPAAAATTVARNILEHGLSPGELVNVNVPAVPLDEFDGVEVTRLGKRVYQDQLIERQDPRGIPYFWIGGPPPSGLAVEGTDFHAVVNRRISVTPIHLDLTGRRLLKRLRTWDWALPEAPVTDDEVEPGEPPEPPA